MTIPVIAPLGQRDPTSDRNFSSIREALAGGLDLRNFNVQIIEGTTASEVDTKKFLNHSMTPPPAAWFALVGDVYVQEISEKYVDVRSTKPGVNFKIILIGGGSPQSVTPGVTSVGDDSYASTREVIQSTPIIIEAGIEIKPVFYEATTSAVVAGANGTAAFHSNIVNDSTYFYVTQTSSGTGNNNKLARVHKSTGVVTTLTLGTIQLGPMTFFGGDLYVSSGQWDGVDTLRIYKINTTTFTATTIDITGLTTVQYCSDIYIDGTSIYVSGSSGGFVDSILVKGPIAGGAGSILTLHVTDRTGGKIIDKSGKLWVTTARFSSLGGVGSLAKVDKAGFTLDAIYTPSGSSNPQLRNMVFYGGKLYMPECSFGEFASDITLNAYQMDVFDIASLTFTSFPLIAYYPFTNGSTTALINNIAELGGIIFTIYIHSFGVTLNGFDTITNTQQLAWFPFDMGTSQGLANFRGSMNTHLVQDFDSGELILVGNQSNQTLSRHFDYFFPEMEQFF